MINLIDNIIDTFEEKERDTFFSNMQNQKKRINNFLSKNTKFSSPYSKGLFLFLREWNSFTPAIPTRDEIIRGGGYFILYKDQGIVIDPGYDFIKNFETAGGRICDINHIIITHAHNDHTQDCDSLLSLLYQFNRTNDTGKKVNLYLSQGVERKFSAVLPLRASSFDTPHIDRIEIMNQGNKRNPQFINLHGLDGAKLCILKAFHDDIITTDYSVGLGFIFDFDGSEKKIVFTGDTGLLPAKKDDYGKLMRDDQGDLKLDIDFELSKAIYNYYPETFYRPDFLIPHLGSIKEREFYPEHLYFPEMKIDNISPKYHLKSSPTDSYSLEKNLFSFEKDFPKNVYFYPNHLGLRGLILLLSHLRPKCCIVSEFGEELKEIRFDLVKKIGQIVNTDSNHTSEQIFIVPGDVTLYIDLIQNKFFCHGTEKFEEIRDLDFLPVEEPKNSIFYSKDTKRTYLFKKPIPDRATAEYSIEKYYVTTKHRGFIYSPKVQS